jgi:hypothetical protein
LHRMPNCSIVPVPERQKGFGLGFQSV